MRLLVLAGGFGTRLRPVIFGIPKALAPIGNIPFLMYQIENWKKQGVRSFVFLLHYQAELIIEFLKNELNFGVLVGCEVYWVIEPTPMGTGGALKYAIDKMNLEGDFLVGNADTWVSSGISKLIESSSSAILVKKMLDCSRYGSIEFNESSVISKFHEKQNVSGEGWINSGFYKLNTADFEGYNSTPFSLETSLFPFLVTTNRLRAIAIEGDFIDIGVPDDYHKFCHWVNGEK